MTISRRRLTGYFSSLIIFAALSACSSHGVNLIHPQSGATAECSASGVGFGATFSAALIEKCRRTYEDRGYVRTEMLTPEQRASLERRGLLP